MIKLKVKAKIKTIGNSSFVLIPKAICSLMDIEKEYYFTITDLEDEEMGVL